MFFDLAIKFSKIWGLDFACGLFFGECDFPQEKE
jgi:hypothetical protein